MNERRSVRIVTWHNIASAYACLIYLADVLSKDTYVELWSKTETAKLPKSDKVRHVSFLSKWYGKVRKIRYVLCQISVFFQALHAGDQVYIINDWDFFIPLYFAKKLNRQISVIHYNTEIAGRDVKALNTINRFYARHADFPDMIIECLKERAEWRKREFGIRKKIYVINNTIPKQNIHYINESEKEAVIKGFGFEQPLPVLIYAGLASLTRQLSDIIECVDDLAGKLNFCFYCYGSKVAMKKLRNFCESSCRYGNYLIHDAIPRTELIRIMQACDIGFNYYKPDISINHRYAAPSKFFEYIACGLNVLSTNNDGINKIIADNRLGVCLRDDESIGEALLRLLEAGLSERSRIISVYERKYCYEVDSVEAVSKIRELISVPIRRI